MPIPPLHSKPTWAGRGARGERARGRGTVTAAVVTGWSLDANQGVTVTRNPLNWSGRPDSNRRRPAWEVYFTPPPVTRRSRNCTLAARGGSAGLHQATTTSE